MKIGIDIDGVVCDTHPAILARMNAKHGTRYTKDDVSDWLWVTDEGVSLYDEIIEAFKSPEFILSLPTIEGAVRGVSLLSAVAGVEFVTTRNPDTEIPTRDWIRAHFGNYDIYHITGEGRKNHNSLGLIVDDNPGNIEAFTETRRPAIVFDQPWNRGHLDGNELVTRCRGWEEVLDVLLPLLRGV
jgi:5'(3')-deoxyribonucleotidase